MLKTAVLLVHTGICYLLIISQSNQGWEFTLGPVGVLLISTFTSILGGIGHLLFSKTQTREAITPMEWATHIINMATLGAGAAVLSCAGVMLYTKSETISAAAGWAIVGVITVISTMGLQNAQAFPKLVAKLVAAVLQRKFDDTTPPDSPTDSNG